MGGLVARYYLEVLEGWPNCRALITFGTPYRGSLNALNYLANGYKKLFVDLTEVMRSFPAMYQLLPIYQALRDGSQYIRVAEAKQITGVAKQQAEDALAFHREIEAKVNEHQANGDYRDHGYVIVPVVGTRQRTMQSAVLNGTLVTVVPEPPAVIDPLLADGDGTVPRASAIPIELSDAYRDSFTPERHGALQCNPSVLNDLRGRLEQMQAHGLGKVRGPQESPAAAEQAAIALDLDDLYLPDEPVVMQARLVNVQRPPGPLGARIEPVDAMAGTVASTHVFTEGRGRLEARASRARGRAVPSRSGHGHGRAGGAAASARPLRDRGEGLTVPDAEQPSWPPWSRVNHHALARYVTVGGGQPTALTGSAAYDATGAPDGRRAIAQSIYDTLEKQDIRYALESYHPSHYCRSSAPRRDPLRPAKRVPAWIWPSVLRVVPGH